MQLFEIISQMDAMDWLQIIIYVVFPFTVLNTFLGLRSRFLDFQASRGPKSFAKRLERRFAQLDEIEAQKEKPALLIADLGAEILFIGFLVVVGFIVLVANDYFTTPNSSSRYAYYVLAIVSWIYAYWLTVQEMDKLRCVQYPGRVAVAIFELAKKGAKKGYITDLEVTFARVIAHGLWATEGRMQLQKIAEKEFEVDLPVSVADITPNSAAAEPEG